MSRPVIGWGPGNIEIAAERQFDLEFTRANLQENGMLLRWIDAHDVVVNLMVEMGFVGIALVAAFVGLSLRRFVGVRNGTVNRALLAGAFAMASNWMLQPSTIHTVPIALLLFGASMEPDTRRDRAPNLDGPLTAEPRVGAVYIR